MTEYNPKPDNQAEKLIGQLFGRLEAEADPTIARLRLERKLDAPRQPQVRTALKVLAFVTALLALGGWATTAPVAGWDDGQLITIEAPDSFVPAAYPYYAGLFANHAAELETVGAQSLIVDYKQGENGTYYFQLGIIGVNFSEANVWLREVMADTPELETRPYAITQPLLPYRVSVQEMVAFSLFGRTAAEERKVLAAWRTVGEYPQHIYLITETNDYAHRVSMLDY